MEPYSLEGGMVFWEDGFGHRRPVGPENDPFALVADRSLGLLLRHGPAEEVREYFRSSVAALAGLGGFDPGSLFGRTAAGMADNLVLVEFAADDGNLRRLNDAVTRTGSFLLEDWRPPTPPESDSNRPA